jgi:hypothetical protein
LALHARAHAGRDYQIIERDPADAYPGEDASIVHEATMAPAPGQEYAEVSVLYLELTDRPANSAGERTAVAT